MAMGVPQSVRDTVCRHSVVLYQDVQWQWQYTTDVNPKAALWIDVDSSDLQTITTKNTNTAHRCFSISTSTLTIQKVTKEDLGKYYRCYVISGGTQYVEHAAVYKIKDNKEKTGNHVLLNCR